MSSNERILKVLMSAKAHQKFNLLKPDFSNIEDIYSNNMESYFYQESDTKKSKGIEFSKELNRDVLIEPECSKTKDGFLLTENDFLIDELKLMNCYVVGKTTDGDTKRFNYYLDYLNKKLNEPIQPKLKEPKVTAGQIIRKYYKEIQACERGEQKTYLLQLAQKYDFNPGNLKTELSRYRKNLKSNK